MENRPRKVPEKKEDALKDTMLTLGCLRPGSSNGIS